MSLLLYVCLLCFITLIPSISSTSTQYPIGEFILIWNPNDSTFSISHPLRNRIEWETSTSTWITVASTQRTYQESSGNYAVTEVINAETDQYTLDTIKPQQDGSLVLTGTLSSSTTLLVASYSLIFIPTTQSTSHLSFSLSVTPVNTSALTLTKTSINFKLQDDSERIYGGGYQYTYSSLRGHRVPIFVREQGVGRGLEPITTVLNLQDDTGGDAYTSYGSIPHLHTSQQRLLFLDNNEYITFDIAKTTNQTFHIECDTLNINGHIMTAISPLDALSTYTSYIGRQPRLPEWISKGAVVGMQGGQDRVMTTYALLQQSSCPIAAFWLQDWVGSRIVPWGKGLWWNWEYDTDLYPTWPAFVAQMKAQNIQVMSYINPMLKDVSTKSNFRRNLYAEAMANDYLVRTVDGTVWTGYAGASMMDLTNPAARRFYKDIIISMLKDGVQGWMSDFGESLALNGMLKNGSLGHDIHNAWPTVWMELISEAVTESGVKDVVWFARSAYTTSPQFTPLAWMGDQLVTWDVHDGLASSILGMLSAGLIGMQYSHTDIGGYTAISIPFVGTYYRSKELFMRWCELAAFTSVYRTHEGSDPTNNWQLDRDAETTAHYVRLALVYTSWSFYRSTLIDDAVNHGWPILRHMYLHYPADPIALDLTLQYLIGDQLLVAPVTDASVTSVSVYLPAGEWTHVWTGTTYGNATQGGYININTPMGQPAVFTPLSSAVGTQFIANLRANGLLPSPSNQQQTTAVA